MCGPGLGRVNPHEPRIASPGYRPTKTVKTENCPAGGARARSDPLSYQSFAGEFRYSAEQWNFEPEQRNFSLAGSGYSVDMTKINEKSANRYGSGVHE
jgi:hypothetical protein